MGYEESMLQLEEVRRENKTLSNEIKDIMDQISEGGRSIHEIDKIRKRLEKDKKLLEAQCKDAATRADEAEVNALKGGRKAMIKMETRIRELESELDAETRRFGDVNKNLRKSERSIKELTFACDEDRRNHERMQS